MLRRAVEVWRGEEGEIGIAAEVYSRCRISKVDQIVKNRSLERRGGRDRGSCPSL